MHIHTTNEFIASLIFIAVTGSWNLQFEFVTSAKSDEEEKEEYAASAAQMQSNATQDYYAAEKHRAHWPRRLHRRSDSDGLPGAASQDAPRSHMPNIAHPVVDSLHWELPLRVLVPKRPPEFLFERKQEILKYLPIQ